MDDLGQGVEDLLRDLEGLLANLAQSPSRTNQGFPVLPRGPGQRLQFVAHSTEGADPEEP